MLGDQVLIGRQGAVQGGVPGVFEDRKRDVLVGLAWVSFDAHGQELVAPQLVHAALKRAMGVLRVMGEKVPVARGDVPVVKVAHVVIVAQALVRQNVRKSFTAIVPGLPALALEAAAWGEFLFGQFVFDQPQTQRVLVVVIGDGNVRVGARDLALVSQVAKRLVPELDAVAVVQLSDRQPGKIGPQRGQDGVGLRVAQERQKEVQVGGLGARHVVKELVNAKGEFRQMLFQRVDAGRVEHGIALGIRLWQDGVVRDALMMAGFTGDVFPLPVGEVDVHVLLERVELAG